MARVAADAAGARREQILEGALRVFSTRGFVAATNRQIADASQIGSPGLIYHYFASKADLLGAVIERFAPPMQLVLHADDLMALPPRDALTQFARLYLGLADSPTIGPCMRLLMGEALRNPEFARIFADVGPLRVWRLLSTYLRARMDAGELRETNPDIAVRCFLGPLALQLLARQVIPTFEPIQIDKETLIEGIVDAFLIGFAVPAGNTRTEQVDGA